MSGGIGEPFALAQREPPLLVLDLRFADVPQSEHERRCDPLFWQLIGAKRHGVGQTGALAAQPRVSSS